MKKTIMLMLALALLLCACAAETPEPVATEPAVLATQPPTEPPTEPATEPAAEPTAEPEPTQPLVELHSGIREDGSFDEGTLFIGDSLTYGLVEVCLRPNGRLGDACYMAIAGASPLAYFGGPELEPGAELEGIYSDRFAGMLICEGVEAAGAEISAIYFMMGTNYTKKVTAQTYMDIVTHMLENCPDATVYLQKVPFSKSKKVKPDEANALILETYEHFREQGELRVQLVDTQSAIGYSLAKDGIHLVLKGQEKWYQALLDYAAQNAIPQ